MDSIKELPLFARRLSPKLVPETPYSIRRLVLFVPLIKAESNNSDNYSAKSKKQKAQCM
jgi:hypothetical protein